MVTQLQSDVGTGVKCLVGSDRQTRQTDRQTDSKTEREAQSILPGWETAPWLDLGHKRPGAGAGAGTSARSYSDGNNP